MPINNERLEKMQEYGLTEYEARTYLALLDLGVATARDIANVSRVPRTKIYSVLDDLHQKQLAEIIPERPKKYEVVPFERYLRTFERDYQAKLKKIEEDKQVLSTAASKESGNGADKAGSFNVLKGRKNVINRMYEMIGRSRATLLEMGTEWSAVRMGYYLPLVKEKARAGVKARLVAPITHANLENVVDFGTVGEVHHAANKAPGSVILIVDDEEVLICHYVPDDEHLFKGEDVAIWSDDRAIVRDMRATIESQWAAGKPLEEALREMRIRLPGAMPKEVA
ncbi:MAG: TrmB family transcriptional regulator [Thermoplasmatota archaeon]